MHTVTPSTVRCNHHMGGAWIGSAPHLLPPGTYALHCESCSIMVNSDAHPTVVLRHIVNAIGDAFPLCLGREAVIRNALGMARRLPFPTAMLKTPNEFLFLAVNGNDGMLMSLVLSCLRVYVAKSVVFVWMAVAFFHLPRCLEAVA